MVEKKSHIIILCTKSCIIRTNECSIFHKGEGSLKLKEVVPYDEFLYGTILYFDISNGLSTFF